MEPGEKLLYSRAEAAAMLSISTGTLDVAIGRGMLRARRQGRRVLIPRGELERFARADHPRIWPHPGPDGKTTRRELNAVDLREKEPVNAAIPREADRPVPAAQADWR